MCGSCEERLAFFKQLRDIGVKSVRFDANGTVLFLRFSEPAVVHASLKDPLVEILEDSNLDPEEKKKRARSRREKLLYGGDLDE